MSKFIFAIILALGAPLSLQAMEVGDSVYFKFYDTFNVMTPVKSRVLSVDGDQVTIKVRATYLPQIMRVPSIRLIEKSEIDKINQIENESRGEG